MSNARNLANLLGTATTIQTAKIADSAITSAKSAIASTSANPSIVIVNTSPLAAGFLPTA